VIRFYCPCGKRLKIPESHAGRVVECIECGQHVQAPSLEPVQSGHEVLAAAMREVHAQMQAPVEVDDPEVPVAEVVNELPGAPPAARALTTFDAAARVAPVARPVGRPVARPAPTARAAQPANGRALPAGPARPGQPMMPGKQPQASIRNLLIVGVILGAVLLIILGGLLVAFLGDKPREKIPESPPVVVPSRPAPPPSRPGREAHPPGELFPNVPAKND
jgi:hypothetical protein